MGDALTQHRAGLASAGWDLRCLKDLARTTPYATLDCLREDLASVENGTDEAAALRAAISYVERFKRNQLRRRRAHLLPARSPLSVPRLGHYSLAMRKELLCIQ